MGDGKAVGYVVIGVLGIAAAVLAFAAEATKIKVSDIIVTEFSCIYPSTSANILGYIAAALTLITQIIISAVARCGCCNGNNNSSGAIVCFVLSWFASVIGIGLLITAANLSSHHEFLDRICYTVKPGVFAGGGCLALVATILGLFAYYATHKYNPQNATSAYQNQGGIAMANPVPQYATAAPNTYSNPNPKQQQYPV